MTKKASAAAEMMKEACAGIADWWTRPDFVRLHAGEMTAQEMRTAVAVARGIAAMIRDEMKVKC